MTVLRCGNRWGTGYNSGENRVKGEVTLETDK
ncbi:hypothetical protein HMPREF0994_05655 [Lachnospiraceae bacterium 3_1_57FAA_CT1]|nr:hypothetical protein HMPREF0994_05655 [Lachnospiraceae bacterium 3_1_57FAA_CT1]